MTAHRRFRTARSDRRRFLKQSLAAAGVVAAPLVLPGAVLGVDGATAPSERVGLGCVGLGIQGMGNMRTFRGNTEVRVAAVCDVHETQRTAAKQSVDEAYESKDCAAYVDFRELIARKDIDAVQVTTPDHWHPLVVIEAARHGKHVYCEKPIGWSFRAAQAVRKAVHERKIAFQFGTQQRSGADFRRACELVRGGKIGELKTILVGVPASWTCPKQPVESVPKQLDYDRWLGPAPVAPYCYQRCRPWTEKEGYSVWYCISDYCMGMIGNWGVHHLDIAQWGNNTEQSGPVEVEGTGKFPEGLLTDAAVQWQVQNRYANGVVLVHMDDATAARHPLQKVKEGHGVLFLGSEGWVHVDRSRLRASSESLAKSKPGPNDVRLFKSDNHHANFIDAVKGRTQPAAPIDAAVRTDALCWLQQIAIKLRRKLRWDPAAESFVDDAEANGMLDRPMRGPWKIG